MAANYTDLKAEIAAYLHRDDLASVLDTFIDFAEVRLNRLLNLSELETNTTFTASAEYLSLPADCLHVRTVTIQSGIPLKYESISYLDLISNGAAGTPQYYSVSGDQIRFYPIPSNATVRLVYQAAIEPLSATNSSNTLLTLHPDIYLYACLCEANRYAQDDGQLNAYEAMLQGAIQEAKRMDYSRRSGTGMTVRAA